MLKQINLTNYRNFEASQIHLQRANIIIAPNGSGKSNLIEAIYYSNFGRSFRTIPSIAEQIRDELDVGRVELLWENEPLLAFSLSKSPSKIRRFEVADKRQPVSKMIGKHNIVLFAPTIVNLVGEDPSLRRDDLDDYLSIISDEYKSKILKYKSTLRSRNVLLKMAGEQRNVSTELTYFTDLLANLGADLIHHRVNFMTEIQPVIDSVGESIFESEGFTITYEPLINPEDYLAEITAKFAENNFKEVAAGKTLYGMHRDDFVFRYLGADLRYRGSRGQQRIASLVYKIAQLEYCAVRKSGPRLILLDDLMSELDESHRNSCAKYLSDGDFQYILTSAEEKDVPEILLSGNKISLF